MPNVCWHCKSTHQCDCVFCGKDVPGGGWEVGACEWCKASKRKEYLNQILERKNIDPREIKNWRSATVNGNFQRIFIPREEVQGVLNNQKDGR